jgi:tetratricopeptide (TPR) repeat protein
VYYKKGDLEKAKDYYERALEIRKEQLGPNHVNVASSYICLGNVYYNKGDLEKARDYYEQALEIRKE